MFRLAIFLLAFGICTGILPAGPQGKEPAKELLEYVQSAKKAGLKDAQIEQNAVKAGWPQDDVHGALESLQKQTTQAASWDSSHEKQPPRALAPDSTDRKASSEGAPAEAGLKAEPAKPVAEAPVVEAGVPKIEGPTKPATLAGGPQDAYQIGEGDVLQISVWGERDASVPSGVVRPDGMISMPLIKDVRVAGLTTAEAEKLITAKLSTQIRAADVTVIVSQINSKKIFVVGGGVKKEGPLAYTYQMTIMQALSEAGGLTDYAKRKKIYVLRNENGRQFKLPFDYDAVLNGEHMELNIPMLPGDTLVVPNH